MADIKKVKLGDTTYNIVDEWARRRLEGANTVYSISVIDYADSRYWDVINNEEVTLDEKVKYQVNTLFKTDSGTPKGSADVNIPVSGGSGTGPCLVLLSYTQSGHPQDPVAYRNVIFLSDLTIGDSVFIKEDSWYDQCRYFI